MAVFPDRIVLKNSSDTDAAIKTAIGSGGSDQINLGELVLGISSGKVRIYSIDSGNVVQTIESTPLTTDGDILIQSSGTSDRLAIGTEKQLLAVSSGLPAWSTPSIDDLSDVDTVTSPPTPRDGLVWDGSIWAPSTLSIDDLSDVDTVTSPPAIGNGLVWDGSIWAPGVVSGGGGGGGSGTGTLDPVTAVEVASSGTIDFTGLGQSGVFVSLLSNLDAWVTFYPTAAYRTADASRSFGVDPAPGSGVLAEYSLTASTEILTSPSTLYFNADTVPSETIYAAVRDTSGNNVNATITVKAYKRSSFQGFGTNRVTDSGLAASGALELTGIGLAGQLVTVSSDLTAWIVVYGSAADRTADSARAFNTDPSPGSGVQAEFYVSAGSTVLATPGTTYYNNDTDPSEIIYFAVRDQSGNNVNATLTLDVYAETSFTGVSGGTFGSG